MKPLFMWAGGKTKLLEKYEPFLPEKFSVYHEPFFGGGAMFTWAYKKNPNAEFMINDVNPHIIQIYRTIKDDPKTFCSAVDNLQDIYLGLPAPTKKMIEKNEKTGKKKTLWVSNPAGAPDKELEKSFKKGNTHDWEKIYDQKQTRRTFFFHVRQKYQEHKSYWHPSQEAAVLYFLMKTGFNGVWQLSKKNGKFNTPCGLMRHVDSIYDKENVMEWHTALKRSTITNLSFQDTLSSIGQNSFTFLDPPYRSASETEKTFADYGTELGDKFQEEVIDFFNKARHNGSYTFLSNRDWGDGFFEKRVGNNKIEYFDVTYTVGRKKKEADGHSATKAREILMIGEPSEQ